MIMRSILRLLPALAFVLIAVPAEVQPPTFFIGALTTNSQQADAAVALLRFLSSAEAAAVITKAGLMPLGR